MQSQPIDHLKARLSHPSATLERYKTQGGADIPGYFSPEGAVLFDIFLGLQEHEDIRGNMLEIGVYKGKSVALAVQHLRPEEQFVMIDGTHYIDEAKATLEPYLKGRGVYHKKMSNLITTESIGLAPRSMRWIHIDGGHTGYEVTSDLEMAEKLLADDGVLAMDDFFFPMYPQVTEAIYGYLANNPFKLTLILVGYLKGYFCRPSFAWRYREAIRHVFPGALRSRGLTDFTLYKTTPTEECATYGIAGATDGRTFYGLDNDPDRIL